MHLYKLGELNLLLLNRYFPINENLLILNSIFRIVHQKYFEKVY